MLIFRKNKRSAEAVEPTETITVNAAPACNKVVTMARITKKGGLLLLFGVAYLAFTGQYIDLRIMTGNRVVQMSYGTQIASAEGLGDPLPEDVGIKPVELDFPDLVPDAEGAEPVSSPKPQPPKEPEKPEDFGDLGELVAKCESGGC